MMAEPLPSSSSASERSVLSRRKDRDIWISRGHLRAAAVGVILVGVSAFAFGYTIGVRSHGEQVQNRVGVTADVPGDELVDLLSRIEAAAERQGAVDRLTFPDALREVGGAPQVPLGGEAQSADEVVEIKTTLSTKKIVEEPEQTFSVRVAEFDTPDKADGLIRSLQNAGIERVDTLLTDGLIQVRVGPFESEKAARAGIAQIDSLGMELSAEIVDD